MSVLSFFICNPYTTPQTIDKGEDCPSNSFTSLLTYDLIYILHGTIITGRCKIEITNRHNPAFLRQRRWGLFDRGKAMKTISITSENQNHEIMPEEIMGLMDCPNDFPCYKKKLRPLCNTKDIAKKDYVLVSHTGHWCTFLMVVGEIYYCRCPLCVYLTRKNYWKERSREKL